MSSGLFLVTYQQDSGKYWLSNVLPRHSRKHSWGGNTGRKPCVLSQITACSCENHLSELLLVVPPPPGGNGMPCYMVSEHLWKSVFQEFCDGQLSRGRDKKKRGGKKRDSRNRKKRDTRGFHRVSADGQWKQEVRGECWKLGRL